VVCKRGRVLAVKSCLPSKRGVFSHLLSLLGVAVD
jgi:hypothetical protein